MLPLDDFYGEPALLRRWFIVNGEPCCPFDAVQPWAISIEDKNRILAQNQKVRDWVAYDAALDVEPESEGWEAAVQLLSNPEPELPPEPVDEFANLAPVPYEIPVRAAEIVMAHAGYYDQLKTLVEALPILQRIEFERAATWKRDHPIVLGAAATMQPPLSIEQVNHLFRLAEKLG